MKLDIERIRTCRTKLIWFLAGKIVAKGSKLKNLNLTGIVVMCTMHAQIYIYMFNCVNLSSFDMHGLCIIFCIEVEMVANTAGELNILVFILADGTQIIF